MIEGVPVISICTQKIFGLENNKEKQILCEITYSTDTTTRIPGANLTITRSGLSATGNSTSGYFTAGSTLSSIDKVTYFTDTTALIPAVLSVTRGSIAASSSVANAVRGTTPQVPIV